MTNATTTQEDWTARAATRQRAEILRIASGFTTLKAIPARVLAIATPLMAWLDQAPDDTDREARLAAIHQVDVIKPTDRTGLLNDPKAVLQAATAFHAFIANRP